ncbi:hypothetical protein ACHAPA_012099 [Fusarium lateritium]
MLYNYFQTICNERAYEQKAADANPLFQLDFKCSSGWDGDHALACHVVAHSRNYQSFPFLKDLIGFPDRDIPAGHGRDQINKLISGLQDQHATKLENQLVHEADVGVSLGQFWSAFKDLRLSSSEEPASEQQTSENNTSGRPQRTQTAVNREGLVNTLEALSSSQTGSSSQPFPSSPPTVFYIEPQSRTGTVLEDYTVRMAFCMFRHILWYSQSPDDLPVVELRQRERACFTINGETVTAIDDGGFLIRSEGGKKSLEHVVLIEAKRRLDVVDNKALVSNSVLGQMLCEAIAARAVRQKCGDDVFIINATGQYVCFFHFRISDVQLQSIADGETPADAIDVTGTRWFDVQNASERKYIVRNICQLVAYLKHVHTSFQEA